MSGLLGVVDERGLRKLPLAGAAWGKQRCVLETEALGIEKANTSRSSSKGLTKRHHRAP